jgi:hypothetical protein
MVMIISTTNIITTTFTTGTTGTRAGDTAGSWGSAGVDGQIST